MQNVLVTRKGRRGPIPARVFFILAREAPLAVVFRRGPSRWVQLLKWRTDTDTFESGQWFHGRIYERRSDLTPDGSLMIYFANKINERTLEDEEYTYAWTGVSKPPFLTALALWPKGDCWHGGGAFTDGNTVVLNHKADVAASHPKHKPGPLKVILKDHVHGEDDPIFSERLQRDGWAPRQEWIVENRGYPQLFSTVQPEIREKRQPNGRYSLQLKRAISRLEYSEEFVIVDREGGSRTRIERASWADWDQQGRLVFAVDGKLMSALIDKSGSLSHHKLLDLNPSTPAPAPAPEWATKW